VLHESAIARGTRPHWFGYIAVGKLGGAETMAARFVELGALLLGPPPGASDFRSTSRSNACARTAELPSVQSSFRTACG
jgi:hypothetical protein